MSCMLCPRRPGGCSVLILVSLLLLLQCGAKSIADSKTSTSQKVPWFLNFNEHQLQNNLSPLEATDEREGGVETSPEPTKDLQSSDLVDVQERREVTVEDQEEEDEEATLEREASVSTESCNWRTFLEEVQWSSHPTTPSRSYVDTIGDTTSSKAPCEDSVASTEKGREEREEEEEKAEDQGGDRIQENEERFASTESEMTTTKASDDVSEDKDGEYHAVPCKEKSEADSGLYMGGEMAVMDYAHIMLPSTVEQDLLILQHQTALLLEDLANEEEEVVLIEYDSAELPLREVWTEQILSQSLATLHRGTSTAEKGPQHAPSSASEKAEEDQEQPPHSSHMTPSETGSSQPPSVATNHSASPDSPSSSAPPTESVPSKSARTESVKPKSDVDWKLRFNYASEECGAKILAANPESSGADQILTGSSDKYMLSPCSVERYVVIELCEEVDIDTMVLANLEYFSSCFKDFALYGSKQFPVQQWKNVANFTAQNVREKQVFEVVEPAIFKYIKIVFLSHYGSEFYCPVTQVNVYGSDLVEGLKEHVERGQAHLISVHKSINELIKDLGSDSSANSASSSPASSSSSNSPSSSSTDYIPVSFMEYCENFDLYSLLNEGFLFNEEESPENHPKEDTIEKFIFSSVKAIVDAESLGSEDGNIFTNLATRLSSLEVQHSLLSGYMDHFVDRFTLATKEIKDVRANVTRNRKNYQTFIRNIANSTSKLAVEQMRLSQEMNEMNNAIFQFSTDLTRQMLSLEKELETRRHLHYYELLVSICISIGVCILITFAVLHFFFEMQPKKKVSFSIFPAKKEGWKHQRSTSAASIMEWEDIKKENL